MTKTARSGAGAGPDTPVPPPQAAADTPATKPNLAPTTLPPRDEFTGLGGDYEVDPTTGQRRRVNPEPAATPTPTPTSEA